MVKTHPFAQDNSIISEMNQNINHSDKHVLISTFLKNLPYKNIPTNYSKLSIKFNCDN